MSRTYLPFTPEQKARVSEAVKASWTRPEVRANHFTPEHRAALSIAKIGNRNLVDASVKGECVYCGGPATERDHPYPDNRDLTVLSCRFDNTSKGHRTPEEWLAAGLRAS